MTQQFISGVEIPMASTPAAPKKVKKPDPRCDDWSSPASIFKAAGHFVVNTGLGVQSRTILELVREGKLPKPERFLFSDTGWEPDEVYEAAKETEWILDGLGIAFDRVDLGDIRGDHVRRAAGMATNSGKDVPRHLRSFRSMPLFTRLPNDVYLRRLTRYYVKLENWDQSKGEKPKKPLQDGMARRQCTERYKIQPIQRRLRSIYGKGEHVVQWFGISTDEASRERISTKRGYHFAYPLLYDVPMSRVQCIAYLESRGVKAAKSACIACPYHSRDQWLEIRADPKAWASAVEFDRLIRHMPGMRALCYVHPSRMPLDQVDLDRNDNIGQEEIFGMQSECVGMCGL